MKDLEATRINRNVMADILPTLLEEFHDKLEEVKKGVSRQASFPEAENMIKVAIGMRRAGKTYFALQKVLEFIQNRIPIESILYINFEDDRLLPMDHKNMGKLIDEFYTLFPENHNRTCYLFLDEVQNVTNWALAVRRIFDIHLVNEELFRARARIRIRLSGNSCPCP
jgi:uncharacterized protein